MGCNCGCGCGGAMGLAHIGVMVSDIQKSLEFYKGILEFDNYYNAEVSDGGTVTKLAFLRSGACVIELVQLPAAQARKDGVIDHIALSVKGIDAIVLRLAAAGVEFETKEPAHLPMLFDNGAKSVFFRGPDGERLELFEEL